MLLSFFTYYILYFSAFADNMVYIMIEAEMEDKNEKYF